MGPLAKVAGRQGAAPPGSSAAVEEREEGTSVEAVAGNVLVSSERHGQVLMVSCED